MGTFHQRPLSDNWAVGTAFRLHYETARYHGWYLTVVGQFGYALASSDLTSVDDLTGQGARFELQMFDIEDPTNRKDFDRLENLTLNKQFKRGLLTVGRYSLETPFVNGQDTRLKANAFSGVTAFVHPDRQKHHKVTAAWVHGISPRGTIKWFDLQNSLGLLNNGLREDGSPAEYHDFVSSKALLLAGWEYDNTQHSAQVWHYYADNLLIHNYGRYTQAIGEHWNLGIEGLYQERLGDGGNELEEHRYYLNDAPAILLGGRVRYEKGKSGLELATLNSIGDGTYLFPREWGRERFFTTVPRARVEGLGNFSEVSIQADTKITNHGIARLTMAYLDVPEIEDALHNKYSLVDHILLNGEILWDAHHMMENTSFRFIAATHFPVDSDLSPRDLYYKAEFVHVSLQMDMHF